MKKLIMETNKIESSPLRALFWREEILQVLYWMDGEGFGSRVSAPQIITFLNTNSANLLYHLEKMVEQGYLDLQGDSFGEGSLVGLSSLGKKEAGRQFSEAFQGLQKAGHGECGPGCEFCYGTDGSKLDNCVHNCASQNG